MSIDLVFISKRYIYECGVINISR